MEMFRPRKFLRRVGVRTHIPAAITMFVLAAHFSELTKALEHVTAWEILTAIVFFGLWVATGTGTEPEL